MAFTLEDRDVRPLTADEVLQMVELGILSEDEPVELLHGALTTMSAKTPAHEVVKMRLTEWLPSPTDPRYMVRTEAPISVPDRTSLPEPDLAVVIRGDYLASHPATALLVIEVAVSSVRVDTQVKPALFAAAGVRDYWVVDVPGRCVRTFAEPDGDVYAVTGEARAGDHLAPRAVAIDALDVRKLLAGI
ncbi:MAG: Uma2 family endonuclease [Solirubrobacteraceae bacterium]